LANIYFPFPFYISGLKFADNNILSSKNFNILLMRLMDIIGSIHQIQKKQKDHENLFNASDVVSMPNRCFTKFSFANSMPCGFVQLIVLVISSIKCE
jgi:hypothetical protein